MKKYYLFIPLVFEKLHGSLVLCQIPFTGDHLVAKPPSLNAAILGVYGAVPVNHYPGVPGMNLPIYSITNETELVGWTSRNLPSAKEVIGDIPGSEEGEQDVYHANFLNYSF